MAGYFGQWDGATSLSRTKMTIFFLTSSHFLKLSIFIFFVQMALITPYVGFTGLFIYFYYYCFIFFCWFPLLIVLKHGWFLGKLGCWNSTQRVNSGIPFLLKHYLFAHFLCSMILLTSKVEMCSQTHFCSDNLISAMLKPLFGNVSLA